MIFIKLWKEGHQRQSFKQKQNDLVAFHILHSLLLPDISFISVFFWNHLYRNGTIRISMLTKDILWRIEKWMDNKNEYVFLTIYVCLPSKIYNYILYNVIVSKGLVLRYLTLQDMCHNGNNSFIFRFIVLTMRKVRPLLFISKESYQILGCEQ